MPFWDTWKERKRKDSDIQLTYEAALALEQARASQNGRIREEDEKRQQEEEYRLEQQRRVSSAVSDIIEKSQWYKDLCFIQSIFPHIFSLLQLIEQNMGVRNANTSELVSFTLPDIRKFMDSYFSVPQANYDDRGERDLKPSYDVKYQQDLKTYWSQCKIDYEYREIATNALYSYYNSLCKSNANGSFSIKTSRGAAVVRFFFQYPLDQETYKMNESLVKGIVVQLSSGFLRNPTRYQLSTVNSIMTDLSNFAIDLENQSHK